MVERRNRAGWRYERELRGRGFVWIAGVDEVGRGCLAGPVVAGAVILDPGRPIRGLRDSKQLLPEERERLAKRIAVEAVACGIGLVDPQEIDRTNILRATLRAMLMAVETLRRAPDFVLVDALAIPGLRIPQRGIVRGDEISASIAAASILAKVYRDAMMRAVHADFPDYCFHSNKGYGTADHWSALRRLGTTPLHRLTFCDLNELVLPFTDATERSR